jgi:Fur family peroxide stress response transcriptional regulator
LAESDIVQTIIRRFSNEDIRLTPQRISVYKYLLENRIHPTVDTVYGALKLDNPSLSKTTIYNTVDALTKAGLVRVVRTKEGEVRLDGYTDRHGHFYCTQCENVFDFSLDGCAVPDSLTGFHMEEFDVRASGLCGSCKSNM